jgi:hypothetical protein
MCSHAVPSALAADILRPKGYPQTENTGADLNGNVVGLTQSDLTPLAIPIDTRWNSMTRRLRVQFSLRAMVLAILVAGPIIGFMYNSVYRATLQRRSVAAIESKGGSVFYDYQFMEDGDMKHPTPYPPGPAWLRRIVGDDYFRKVIHLKLKHGGLDHLSGFPSVESLVVPSSLLRDDDSDFELLPDLVHLRSLLVQDDSGPSDRLVIQLSQLTQLQHLSISKSLLTKEEMIGLEKALPDCKIWFYGPSEIVW